MKISEGHHLPAALPTWPRSGYDFVPLPYYLCGAAQVLGGGLVLLLGLAAKVSGEEMPWPLLVPTVALVVGGLLLALGRALQRRSRHAWLPAVFIGILGLAAFPIGTAIFGAALYFLWRERAAFFPFDAGSRK